MPFSKILQLYLPSLFPLSAYEEFVEAVRAMTDSYSDSRREFDGASNLIGWRFRTCVEDKESYMASWRQYGADVSFDALYERERLLFGTFVSGVSCIEAAVYACYALASHPKTLHLNFDVSVRRYRSGPKHFLKALKGTGRTLALVPVMEGLVSSDEWAVWTGFRNTMTHRSDLPRINYGAVGGPAPQANPLEFAATWSSKALSGDEVAFGELIDWLASRLEAILRAGSMLSTGA